VEKATTQDFHENGYATMKLERNPKSNLEDFFFSRTRKLSALVSVENDSAPS
jgi:hypothetical protein